MMWGANVLLVLSIAAYVQAEEAGQQQLYCPDPNGIFPVQNSDCRKYMVCQEGKSTIMDCPPGLVFNPKNNWCDLPQNVRCNSNIVVAPASTPAPASTTTLPVTYAVSAIYQAPVQVLTSARVPVQYSTPSPVVRPARTVAVAPVSVRAVAPPAVPAANSIGALALTDTLAPGIPIEFNCQQSNGYHAIVSECDTYIVCQGNVAYKALCPDGLHFNPEAKYPEYACAYSPKVECARGVIEQNPKATNECPRQYGFFPMSDGDCSKYIRCHEGIATVMDCAPGLVFNRNENSCDWPENVPNCKSNVFQGFTCPDARLEADGSISDLIVKYKYNNECSKFVVCHKGSPRLLKCEAGKSFEEASLACVDSAYVTNCENRS